MGFPKDFLDQLADEKGLTHKEKEVFLLLFGEGKSRIEIGEILFVKESAIGTRLTGIYNKFQIVGNGPVKECGLKDYLNSRYQRWQPENPEPPPIPVIPEPSLSSNPFTPLSGSIENPFGREREIRRIFELLNSGSSVALIGEEAIGKSSILQAVRQQATTKLNPSRKPIYLDLGHVEDEKDFYFALCDQVGIEEEKGYRLCQTLKKYRLLLILDNVGKMACDRFTNNVRSQLRSLADGGNPPLRLVVATRTPLDKLFPDNGMTSPFHNIFQEETIKQWDEMTCRNFIESRLNYPVIDPKAKSVKFSEDDISSLVKESKGYPQKLMLLCHQTFSNYLEN